MDYSLAGLVGSAVAIVASLAVYFATIPSLQERLRAIAPSETAEQREDLEFKLGVMRRLILIADVVGAGLGGYWVGRTIAG